MAVQQFTSRLTVLLLLLLLVLAMSPTTLASSTPTRAGKISEYRLPFGYDRPYSITAGPDGNTWFTNNVNMHASVARISPVGKITEYPLTSQHTGLSGIALGPDGNLWFAEGNPLGFGSINPFTGKMTDYSFQSSYYCDAMTFGLDGNIWCVDTYNSDILRYSLKDHSLIQFPLPTQDSQPVGITSGSDGNIWFTEFTASKIGHLNPKTGKITELPLYISDLPGTITRGPTGYPYLWYVTQIGVIGRINPFNGRFKIFSSHHGSTGPGIGVQPDGSVWFAEQGWISRITPDGNITDFPISTPDSDPQAITSGPDGNIWFTNTNNNRIGKITTK